MASNSDGVYIYYGVIKSYVAHWHKWSAAERGRRIEDTEEKFNLVIFKLQVYITSSTEFIEIKVHIQLSDGDNKRGHVKYHWYTFNKFNPKNKENINDRACRVR